jgi:hypothetical protein
MALRAILTALLLLLAGGTLEAPFRLAVKGEPIDVEAGHADPFVCDWDGDGLPDLLVGQFGSGRLQIFRNTGTRTAPKLAAPEVFTAGGAEGTVPFG